MHSRLQDFRNACGRFDQSYLNDIERTLGELHSAMDSALELGSSKLAEDVAGARLVVASKALEFDSVIQRLTGLRAQLAEIAGEKAMAEAGKPAQFPTRQRHETPDYGNVWDKIRALGK